VKGNHWSDRANFRRVPGKYVLLEVIPEGNCFDVLFSNRFLLFASSVRINPDLMKQYEKEMEEAMKIPLPDDDDF
jgi:hypothetical protein